MKKGFIVLLMVLVAASAFAGFSGDAYVQFNADLDEKDYGLANSTDVDFTFSFASESIKIKGEEEVHVELTATAKFLLDYDYATMYSSYKASQASSAYATEIGDNYGLGLGAGVYMSIGTAKVVGDNWYISILGPKSSAYNYASAAGLTVYAKSVKDAFGKRYKYTTQAASYSAAYTYVSTKGVTVGYDGYTASVGFDHDADNGTYASATFETKAFKFAEDAITVQAAAEVSKAYAAAINAGASVKASYADEKISASVAADFGLENLRDPNDGDSKFGFDTAASFKYDFITTNVYVFSMKDGSLKYSGAASGATTSYKYYNDFYMDAKASFDLNKFEIPVTVTATVKNIIDKNDAGIDVVLSAAYTKDAVAAGVAGSINTETKSYYTNVYGTYAAEKFTAGANVYLKGADELTKLSAGAFVESDSIVPGATVGASYGLNSTDYCMYYGGAYSVKNYKNTNNFIGDSADAGTIGMYCIINF